MLIKILLALILGACKANFAFHSLYDLAIQNEENIAIDLIGNRTNITGGRYIEYGFHFSQSNDNEKSFNIALDSLKELTVVAVIKPRECKTMQRIFYLILDEDAGCQLRCNRNRLEASCSESIYISISIGDIEDDKWIVLGLGFAINGNRIKGLLMYKDKNESRSFFFGDEIGRNRIQSIKYYISTTDTLYYLAVLKKNIDLEELNEFLDSEDPIKKPIRCPNCIDEEELTCEEGSLNSYKMREYFCSCTNNAGYDIRSQKCIEATHDCIINCSQGCRKDATFNCLHECPRGYSALDIQGDFYICKCESDGLCDNFATQEEEVEDEDEESNKTLIILLIVLPAVLVIIACLIAFCAWRNSECCKKSNEEAKGSHPPIGNSGPTNDNGAASGKESGKENGSGNGKNSMKDGGNSKHINSIGSYNYSLSQKRGEEDNKSKIDNKCCVVCCQEFDTNDRRKMELIPCGHKVTCESCLKSIEKNKYKCPIDQTNIQGYKLC